MIKAVIYDFDGTLVDNLHLHIDAYRETLLKLGVKADNKKIIKKCFNKLDGQAARNFGVDVKLFSRYYYQGIIERNKYLKLIPGVTSVLKQIKKMNLFLGLGSLRNQMEIKKIKKVISLEKYFDVIVPHSKKHPKKPEIFSEVVRKLKLSPKQVLFVGDATNDLQATKKIGAHSVLFFPKGRQEYYSLNSLKKLKPEYIIENHKEIIGILRELDV